MASNATNSVNIKGASTMATLTGVTLNQVNSSGNTMSSLTVSNGATLYLGGGGTCDKPPQPNGVRLFGNGGATVGAMRIGRQRPR